MPQLPVPAPFRYRPIHELDLREFGAVICTVGFRANYQCIDGAVTDYLGFPHTRDGASTVLPGLYFCGVHYLRKRRSSLLFGVGEDAAVVARDIAAHQSRQMH